MQKIPTIFEREGALAVDRKNDEAAWVFMGWGLATRKWDGTACLIRDGQLYKRSEWSAQRGPPPTTRLHWDFKEAPSGHGWILVGDGPEDWMHRAAWARGLTDMGHPLIDGTYELIGPRIGKNPENVESEVLVPHGRDILPAPRDFDGLRAYLSTLTAEGVVWYHPSSSAMAKIKRRDFGLRWPIKEKA